MKKIIKIKKTPYRECPFVDMNYPEYIYDFINKMNKYDLSKFYSNIQSLDIKEVNDGETELPYAGAEYNVFSNKIQCRKGFIKRNIMHELFHTSTRIRTKERVYCGFMQILEDGYGLGNGLNEGYTELMDNRYFLDYDVEKKKEIDKIYPLSKYVCNMLEYLLGQEHMEELYMNADLAGLYKELSFYSSPRKAYEFIIRVDRLFTEGDIKTIPNIFNVIDLYDNILFFISECFLTKFRMMYINKELNDEEYERCLGFVKFIMDKNLTYFKVINSRKLTRYYDKLNNKVIEKVNKKSRVK